MNSSPERLIHNTIDAGDWLKKRNAQSRPKQWFVVQLCNQTGGEHTKIEKTQNALQLYQDSPISEGSGKVWAVSNIVCVGPNEQDADAVIKLIGDNIRGARSKGASLDVIAAHYNLDHWCSFDKLFKIEGADKKLRRVSGSVDPD